MAPKTRAAQGPTDGSVGMVEVDKVSSSSSSSRYCSQNFAKSGVPSKSCRTSVSPTQPGQCLRCSSMKCFAPSRASSFEFNSKIAKPPTTSLAYA